MNKINVSSQILKRIFSDDYIIACKILFSSATRLDNPEKWFFKTPQSIQFLIGSVPIFFVFGYKLMSKNSTVHSFDRNKGFGSFICRQWTKVEHYNPFLLNIIPLVLL